MNEPECASLRSTQTIALFELGPLNPTSWEHLLAKVRGQNDPLSIKSLEIIINGLKELDAYSGELKLQGKAPPELSPLSQSMFMRLAKAYNSPTLLKEVGLIYLRDLQLPNVAMQHFERSLRLGGPEKELRPLTEAAAVAVQKQLAQLSGSEQAHSGITTAQQSQPAAITVIRKTGKLLLPSRFTQTGATTLTAADAGLDDGIDQPLPDSSEECFQEAAEAIKRGQLRRAGMLLEKSNQKPLGKMEMWQGWTDLGQAYYETGQHPQVEAAFMHALDFAPEDMASHFNAGLGHHLNGRYEEALTSYLHANKIGPKHPKVWCNMGVLYFQLDQYAEAEAALRNATLSDGNYARAWDNLAASLGAQDKLDEAMSACERAVQLRPDYPEVYFKMGVIFFARHDLKRAEMEFKRAALLPALSAYCDCFQAMIFARLEQPEAAEDSVKKAYQTDPKCYLLWMAWNDIGLALYAAGKYNESAVAYGEATMIKPDEPEAWFNLGVSYHQSGDLKAARDSYQHAVDLKEDMAGAWHNLGIVCAQYNDHSAAMQAFRQEVHWSSTNIRGWYDLGVTLEKLGRNEEAKIAFAKVDKLSAAAGASSRAAINGSLPGGNAEILPADKPTAKLP